MYFRPSRSFPLLTSPKTNDARTSIMIMKDNEKYMMKVGETESFVSVNGRLMFACPTGRSAKSADSTPTRTDERPKRIGAPAATAKNMKIVYMRTFDAARFCTNIRSRMFDAVSSRRIEIFPPEIIPEFMSSIVFFISSDWIRSPILRSACVISFPATISFPNLKISWSSGENSFLELKSNALSIVIPARRFDAISAMKSGNTSSIFFSSPARCNFFCIEKKSMASASMLIEIPSVIPMLWEMRKVILPMISVVTAVPIILTFSVFLVSILEETWSD